MSEAYIPADMKLLPCWILWRLEPRQGRPTKVPYRPDGSGRKASATDASTWGSFDAASARWEAETDRYNGIGFVVQEGSGLVFIDLDHCVDERGALSDFAARILEWFPDTYAELSQSGEGLHIFCRGSVPHSFRDSKLGLEVYTGKRYAAMTGSALQPCELCGCQKGLDWLWAKYGEKKTEITSASFGAPTRHTRGHSAAGNRLSDADVISRLQQHGRGAALWAGDWQGAGYSSRSEADAALCTILAFWTDKDAERVERLFFASGLTRDKWVKRQDYRQRTVTAGCSVCGETLSDYSARNRRKEAEELNRILRLS